MKKNTLIKAMSQISDEHIAEFADLSPKPPKKLDKFKSYAVLAAGVALMLCTAPIVYYTTNNSNIVMETPPKLASNSPENSANAIISKSENSSDQLSNSTEGSESSATLTDNDLKESQTTSEQVTEYSTTKSFEQTVESNMSDGLESSEKQVEHDISILTTESDFDKEILSSNSSDNSNFKDEPKPNTKYLPEEKNIDDFDVDSMGVVVYDGRIYYQDLSMDYNETDIEQLEKMLDDNLGSTIYKNNEWWENKIQNEVLSENFVSSYDGKIYSIKGKRVEEEIAVKISDENDKIIIFLKS